MFSISCNETNQTPPYIYTENIYILKVLLVLTLILRLDVQVSLTKEKGEVLVVLQRLLQKQNAQLAARIHSDLVSAVRLR